jgi:DNA replication protein DnaC
MDFGNVLCPVVDLLTKRYDMQLFTIVTTNLTPAEIREKYGDRVADRMNEMMVKVIFNNETYRN